MWLALLLPLGTAHAAECSATYQDILTAADVTLIAFEDGDSQRFIAAKAELDRDLSCLNGLLEPGDIRTLYLVDLLDRWWRQELEPATQAWQALRRLDPELDLVLEIGLADQRLIAWAEDQRTPSGTEPTVALLVVPWSTWRVEGADGSRAIPVGRPVFVQLMDTRDGRLGTWYLPEGGLPDGFETARTPGTRGWLSASAPEPETAPPQPPARSASDPAEERRLAQLEGALQVPPVSPRRTGLPVLAAGGACVAVGAATAGITYGLGVTRRPVPHDQAVWLEFINFTGWGLGLSGVVVGGIGGVRMLGHSGRAPRLRLLASPGGAVLVGAW